MLWSIIVGGFIGLAAGAITKKRWFNGNYRKYFCWFNWVIRRPIAFWNMGSFSSGNVTYSIDCWCGDCCRCSIILFG